MVVQLEMVEEQRQETHNIVVPVVEVEVIGVMEVVVETVVGVVVNVLVKPFE